MKYIALLLMVFCLIACSNPKSQIIPADTSKMEEIAPSVKQLSEKDRNLFMGYMVRKAASSAFGGEGVAPGTTIGQAIEDQEKYVKDQERKAEEERLLKEKIAQERAAKQKYFDEAIAVAFIGKKMIPSDMYSGRFQDQIKVVFGFKNKSEKDIAGIKGNCKFLDMFGDEVKTIGLSFDEGVTAGKTKEWAGYVGFNQFIDEDNKFASADQSKLKFVFEPQTIIFKDGSKLEMPESI